MTRCVLIPPPGCGAFLFWHVLGISTSCTSTDPGHLCHQEITLLLFLGKWFSTCLQGDVSIAEWTREIKMILDIPSPVPEQQSCAKHRLGAGLGAWAEHIPLLHVSLQGQRLNKVWVCTVGWFGKGCWVTPMGIVLPKLKKLLCKFYLCCIHYWCLESSCRCRGCIVFLTTKCWWVKALSWAVLALKGKTTFLLFQLMQVKLSRRGRRLKLLNLDWP